MRSLFDIPEPPVVEPARENNPEKKDLRDEAARWIEAHPEEYAALCARARARRNAKLPVNVSMLAEWMRLGRQAVTKLPGEVYKLNNNHRAYIARRMVADHPELEACFRFRKTRY